MQYVIPALLISACCLFGCQERAMHSISVPDVIRTDRQANDVHVRGTPLFLHNYAALPVDTNGQAFHRDTSISLNIYYYGGAGIDDSVGYFQAALERDWEEGHSPFYYFHDFQMDSCPAKIYYRKSTHPGKDEIALFFDDNAFSVGAITLRIVCS